MTVDDEARLRELRAQLHRQYERRQAYSQALLDPGKSKEEIERLLAESTEVTAEIEALENRIREIQYPGRAPGEPINPWLNQ